MLGNVPFLRQFLNIISNLTTPESQVFSNLMEKSLQLYALLSFREGIILRISLLSKLKPDI